MNTFIREVFLFRVRAFGGSIQSARALGISRAYVDMIAKGDRRPGMRTAYAIERVFGIPMKAWLEPEAFADMFSSPSP